MVDSFDRYPEKRSTYLWAETTSITKGVEKEGQIAHEQKGSELVKVK